MSLVDHLEELRKSVIRVVIIIAISCFIAYGLSDYLTELLLDPLRMALKSSEAKGIGGGQIIYLGLLDKVMAQLQLAIWSGVILSSPLWFFEVWRFIKPGLYAHEVRAVRPFLFFGLLLFWTGVLFTYFVVFPFGFQLLMEYGVTNVTANISLIDYLGMALKIMLFFGLSFQLPNVLVIMGFMGVVTKYTLRGYRRYVYVILSIMAAILTPPDVFSMMTVWIPMVVLYEIGILAVAWVVHPYLAKQHMGKEA